MSRKTDDLEFRCQLLESKMSGVEDRLDALSQQLEHAVRDLYNLDDRIDCHIEGKTRVMLIDSLEAYRKGKAIKEQVDYISEVLGEKK